MQTEQLDVHTLHADYAGSASRAGLRYLPDTQAGIRRRRTGKGFTYLRANGEKVTDPKTIDRIKKLVIPPAWQDVWISPSPNGHIQATGRDTKGRKQYIYHPGWQQVRSLTKFGRMLEFGECLPEIRKQIRKDLGARKLDKRKITAVVVDLLDHCFIRIGNKNYTKENKSFGLTTLRDKHVKIEGSLIRFRFVGKKGVEQEIDVKDKRLARLVKQCQDIPGHDLFQYYDENGQRQTLESGDVNEYLHQLTQYDFTAKDFRTWAGTVLMVESLEKVLHDNPQINKEKAIKEAVKLVAKGLGNTPAVCHKYYIHPQVANLFREDKLFSFLQQHDAPGSSGELSGTERLVIQMLRSLK